MEKSLNILDAYVNTLPSQQNVLDIFDGEWASKFPEGSSLVSKPGFAALFEDARIDWMANTLGGLEGKTILELGPLEGGHSYMMSQMGALKIDSIEANTRAFLKCLCVKEIFNLDSVNFMLGDCNDFLENNQYKYDLIVASGILYHMVEPVKLLRLIANSTDKLMIWTHYYDKDVIENNSALSKKFTAPQEMNIDGFSVSIAEQFYNEALDWQGFCGGSQPTSRWLLRQSILDVLESLGFARLNISFEDKKHPNGPCFALCAERI
ncbi:class I SAM-dependent methyltransferase [Leptothoe spongobia]|uniref:DUF1698 domain-containing protein n=1 Tax=Leptothoe spongobia TAU-MAC 1115 TaxID=1967444 RepID=A0A947GJ77_9CYAN|nr:DUF1698 domain-containing protein [Leptothoe spongobia]MBT9316765.1 DUF1698 domain-containing protein [Leptothoe spongobia TAU-MAC 1115]